MNYRPAPDPVQRVNVLGVPIAAINLKEARNRVIDLAKSKTGGYICVTGAHGIVEAQDDPLFRAVLKGSHFNTPDGMPTVWMGRHHYGCKQMTRVYGPDLMQEVFAAAKTTTQVGERPIRHFFYGGNEGVAEQLRDKLTRQFPDAIVTGTWCPPFRPLNGCECRELEVAVEAADPDIIWVGLSTPKQEKFMATFSARLPGRLMIGVGAAFDIHAGITRSAPRFIQHAGFEWLWRLCAEPKRLFPRYAKVVPRFLLAAGWQIFSHKWLARFDTRATPRMHHSPYSSGQRFAPPAHKIKHMSAVEKPNRKRAIRRSRVMGKSS